MSDKYPGGFVTANAPAGFSVAFDGTGDYLTLGGQSTFAFGSNDFTIEFWFYCTSFTGGLLYDQRPSGSSGAQPMIYVNGSGILEYYTNAATRITASTAVSLNTWYHLALTRSGTSTKLFLSGSQTGSTYSDSTVYVNGADRPVIGNNGTNLANPFNGYISNLRVLNGTAQYTTTFTPPTQLFPITNTVLLACQSPTIIDNSTNAYTITVNGDAKVSNFTPFAAYQGFNPALGAAAGGVWTLDEAAYYQNNRQWPIYDPYFNNTTLMLHGNGTNAAQNNTFLDSSTNNFTITRNGNTTQGSFSPFSQTGWSYNGTAGAYCQLNNADYSLGTGDFTVELWMYCVDDSTYSATNICSAPSNPNFTVGFGSGSAGARQLYVEYGGGATTGVGSSMSGYLNKWTHIAVVRQSGTVTAYQNGVSLGSVSKAAAVGSTANLYLLRNSGDTGQDFRGYVSNFRISKSAVYTSNFTPSTSPFAPVSNTVLLAFQSNRFVDNSANNSTVTPAGTASVQAFSPFVPAYITPTTYSNFFDGSGDYLTASGAGLALGAGNFTVEGWFYTTGYNTGEAIYSGLNTYPASTGLLFYINGSGTYTVDVNGSNVIASGTAPLNTWTHVALVRSSTGSNGLALYINGVSIATGTTANDFTSTYAVIGRTGFGAASNYWLGCLSNIRVLVGTALYTANFTPPTAPLTNITNTSLLTCQSSTFIDNSTANGGVGFTITATGNVQPVTSPTPFPAKVDTTTLNSAYSTSLIGGSAYFDGTGDYLTAANNTAFKFGTGNFTIDGWFYFSGLVGTYSALFTIGDYTNGIMMRYQNSGGPNDSLYIGGTSYNWIPQTNFKLNQWNHVALVKNGTGSNNVQVYINGVSVLTITSSYDLQPTGSVYIGTSAHSLGDVWNGYISNFRLIKGTAVYVSNFSPPTAPVTAVTNTQLLLNYTNGAIFDNTAKNVLETVGNAQISTTQSKWGGSSMYFDGTGDYLRGNANLSNSIAFGTSDFTIELWVYCTSISVGTSDTIIDGRPGANTGNSFLFYLWDGGKIAWYVPSLGTYIVNTGAVSANTWTHVAICRSGSTLRSFKDGVLQQAGTDNVNYMNPGSPYPFIGSAYFVGDSFRGYMDDLRISRYARYITNFTPPTSQLQDQ